MTELKIPTDTFLIKIDGGKLKTNNPHGEKSEEKYRELLRCIELICFPEKNKSSE